DAAKEDPHDFALWKGAKPGEPTWPSPWGPGRPGWHLECSAMSAHYLGQPFDVHGGGSDLVFPHHENEIAQSEGAAGAPLADLWVHNGMITFGADKMSKSLGNVLGIAEATDRFPGEALRLLFFGTHYRAPLDFGPGRLEEAARKLEQLYESLARADEAAGRTPAPVAPAGALTGTLSPFLSDFVAAMDDDLNAARALGPVHDRVRELNRALDAGDATTAAALRSDLARDGAGNVHYSNMDAEGDDAASVARDAPVAPPDEEASLNDATGDTADDAAGGTTAPADPSAFSTDASLRRNALERDLRATQQRLHEVDAHLQVLMVNGGGTKAQNYQSHFLHLRRLLELLARAGVPSDHITVFSADGAAPEADMAVREIEPEADFRLLRGTRLGAALATQIVYANSEIPGVPLRAATRAG